MGHPPAGAGTDVDDIDGCGVDTDNEVFDVVAVPETVADGPLRSEQLLRAAAVATIVTFLIGCLLAGILELDPAVHVGATPGWLAQLFCVGAAGFVVAWARPRNGIGWLLITAVFFQMISLLSAAYAQLEYATSSPGPFALFCAWLSAWTWAPSLFLPVAVLPTIYPTGRPESRFSRVLVWSGLVGIAELCFMLGAGPDAPRDTVPGLRMPYGQPPGWVVVLVAIPTVLALSFAVVGGLLVAVIRTFRARGPERAQMLWLLVPIIIFFLTFYVVSLPWTPPAYALIGLAVAIGVLKYRLLDIQVVVRRTLFYVPLIALVALLVAGMSTLIARVTPSGPLPVLGAAAAVAVLVGPLSGLLRRGVDRLVLGARADPAKVVAHVVARGEVTPSDDPLYSLLEALVEAVGIPYAAVSDPHDEPLAHVGCPTSRTVHYELHAGGEHLGVLSLASPQDGAGTRIASALVPHVASVVRTQRLSADLDVERGRALAATIIERERIRSDLHDGLGPALSGISLGLQAADLSITGDEPVARTILHRARDEADSAVREVRRVLDALGPVALEEQQLSAAIHSAAGRLGFDSATGPSFTCTSGGTTGLPRHVEEAAYLIAGEALHNVARHAHASHCHVVLVGRDGVLELQVTDDGIGLGDLAGSTPPACLGIDSMRRRAHELGGTFQLSPGPTGGGTAVQVQLPLAVGP